MEIKQLAPKESLVNCSKDFPQKTIKSRALHLGLRILFMTILVDLISK